MNAPFAHPGMNAIRCDMLAIDPELEGAMAAVFDNLTVERRQKPIITDVERGTWSTRPVIIVKDAAGRIVSELPESGV